MNKNSDLRNVLIEHHFNLMFERIGETDPKKQKFWREELRESVEEDVDKMLKEELKLIIRNQKREPRSIAEKGTWTTLQVVGNAILAYSINQEDIILISFSVIILVATTVWFWILHN